jgi:hypothetical protein
MATSTNQIVRKFCQSGRSERPVSRFVQLPCVKLSSPALRHGASTHTRRTTCVLYDPPLSLLTTKRSRNLHGSTLRTSHLLLRLLLHSARLQNGTQSGQSPFMKLSGPMMKSSLCFESRRLRPRKLSRSEPELNKTVSCLKRHRRRLNFVCKRTL